MKVEKVQLESFSLQYANGYLQLSESTTASIVKARSASQCKTIIKRSLSYRQWYRLSFDRLLWIQRKTDFL